MNDGSSRGTAHREGMDVSHDIMPPPFFLSSCQGIVDVVDVCLHLIQLFLGDIQPQLLCVYVCACVHASMWCVYGVCGVVHECVCVGKVCVVCMYACVACVVCVNVEGVRH